jgi:RNA polymerase sigma-54 factor
MILRDVAEDIEMHESTVSRVTTNKYVHTPHGIFSLKFFFNSGIQRKDGADVASEMVKQRIKRLVADEDPRKPLSDSALVKKLADENIKIARRTVAKYRDMLSIPSSSQRKRQF